MANQNEEGLMVRGDNALAEIHHVELDTQITTAKAFPRDVALVLEECKAMATMSKEAAQSCQYNLPRAGGIKGDSIRLAEIVASAWGNLRVASRILETTAIEVVAQSVVMDTEKNYMESKEVRRSIVDKNGRRFQDHVVVSTEQAAMSIAKRNAVFGVIPKSFVQEVAEHAKTFLLDGAKTVEERRVAAVEYLDKELGVGEELILKYVKRQSVDDMSMDDCDLLVSVVTSIKSKQATVQSVFYPEKEEPKDGPPKTEVDLEKKLAGDKAKKGTKKQKAADAKANEPYSDEHPPANADAPKGKQGELGDG